MKYLAIFVLALIAFSQVEAKEVEAGLDLCPTCVSFATQSIDQLLNIILNAGVIGGCADLCGYLPNKVEQTVCDLLCDYVGLELFIKLIKEADLDPIYLCELITVCPIHDCEGECITIDEINIVPPSGPAGTEFAIEMAFTVHNQTGTGEIVIDIFPPDGEPFGDGELTEGYAPGKYGIRFGLKTEPTEDEPYSAGTYGVELGVCEGQCGSKHPHSYVYDVKKSSFQITE
jgi:hypothetical protein